ncbi:MAG: DUF2779 domain-containing protein [Erysipelotrichaceae bacterium]|nr:DUF2779 domain-containing protein [Erysipelotrichaceae bacterium]
MYHICDLKKFTKCPRLYFLDAASETSFVPYLRSDESYIDLLKKKLGINECFTGKVGDSSTSFEQCKDSYEWFISTRFEIEDLRIKVPVLHKLSDGEYDVYFMYYGTQIKELDFFSYRVSIEVLEKLGILVNDVFIVYVNPDYVYHDKSDAEELFKITNKFKNGRVINIIQDSFVDFDDIIKRIESSKLEELEPIKTRTCHMKNVCPHYNECFKEEENLEDNSILTLVSSQYKTKMYEENIKYLKDVDTDRLEGNRVQFAQIMADKNGGLFVDKYALKDWLSKLDERPISFIDFEWDRYLIPSYEGMKPLDVVPFEFALYVDNGSGELEHRTFISNGDCRREFAEALIEAIPKTGKILAYNAIGAEIIRIQELANLFPDLEKELLSIVDRFVDLATPFIEGLVYDTRMAGVYSLKKLVSVVSDKSYKDLDIDDGMLAVYNWRNIDKGEDDNEEKTIDDLKKYCSLDAYGLYLVYKWLLTLVK